MDKLKQYLYSLATDKRKGIIPGTLKAFLYLFSLIYGLITRILAKAGSLRQISLNCRLISIGNITLGGTGKTLLVEYVAQYLKSQNRRLVILTRGYKRKAFTCNLAPLSCAAMGDEPYMLYKKLGNIPVVVDKDRIRAAERAVKDYDVDTFILDDGFQQWRLKKDLEIVTINATCPFGNRMLIPRGILREDLLALKRADIFVLTKADLTEDTPRTKDFLSKLNPAALVVSATHEPIGFYALGEPSRIIQAQELGAENVALICGIGDPDSFEALVRKSGLKIGLSLRFPDHYQYSEEDLRGIVEQARACNIKSIITTEKDAVRFDNFKFQIGIVRVFVLKIAIKIENEPQFQKRLLSIYSL